MLKDIDRRQEYFVTSRGWQDMQSPENLAKSISIEAAELLELFQWSSEAEVSRVKEEIADVILYSMQLARHYGFDLEQILNEKMDMNEVKYPHP